MTLQWPWGLIALPVVLAAAVWALRRPMQRIVQVSSLHLWREALAALPASAARSGRRVTAAWVVLLAGAAAAGVALSRPTWYSARPARRVGVAVYPGAELGPAGVEALGVSAAALLDRLGPGDRVRVLLPAALGGAGEWQPPAEAAARIRALRALPVPAGALSLPGGAAGAQHVYRFAPGTLALAAGPTTTPIALPASPQDVTIDAFAVECLPGPAGGAEVFLAVRNHTADRARGSVRIGGDGERPASLAFDIPPGRRQSLIARLPAGRESFWAAIGERPGPGAAAFLAAGPAARVDVAMIGRDDPLVRRFVRVHPALRLSADAAAADAVIAIGTAVPAGRAALVVAPPAPPPPWRRREDLANLTLRDAHVLADHPLLAHVDLSAVAVRRSAAWAEPALPAGEKPIVRIGKDAVMLAGEDPRRVYVGFDLSAENTNFATTEAFVIFLANVVRYLAPARLGPSPAAAEVRYECVTPLQAGAAADFTGVDTPASGAGGFGGPLPAPGLYRDAAGSLHAVSLLGLTSATPDTAPLKQVAALRLPPPAAQTRATPLWPALLLAAVACWLAGWKLRLR